MNTLIELLTKSVFAKANRCTTSHHEDANVAAPQSSGFQYFLDERYRSDPHVYKFLRKNLTHDLTYTEGVQFCRELEQSGLSLLLPKHSLSWDDERPLFEIISKLEIEALDTAYTALKSNFLRQKSYLFPLKRFKGFLFRGDQFSIVCRDDVHAAHPSHLERIPVLQDVELWLQINARSTESAVEKMEVVCGSFSLVLADIERHQKSMANSSGGHLSEPSSYSSAPSRVVPPLPYDFEFEESDKKWLKRLDGILSEQKRSSKYQQALRFFFLAWFADSQERFALNCMAIDALIPKNKHRSMRKKCEWVKNSMSVPVDLYAIELLMKKLRSSLLHGDQASLPLCKEYNVFVESYRIEPLSALDHVVADVLLQGVYPNTMTRRKPILERDVDIKQHTEMMFGKDNQNLAELRAGHLVKLHKNIPSRWERSEATGGDRGTLSALKKWVFQRGGG